MSIHSTIKKKLAYYTQYEDLGPASSTAHPSVTYQHASVYSNGNSWFTGVTETEHAHPHHSSSPPPLLTTYHLNNNGDLISDVYRVPHENGNSNTFYVPYQTTVVNSDNDENDLDDGSDDMDDDDDERDSTYHLPKRMSSNNNMTNNSKSTGNQRRLTRPNGSKRKRKRVLNGVQRAEATQREKRRMLKLNRAFEDLRKVLPVTEFARNKLSRSETLKSAIDYINLMFDMLDASKGHHHHHSHSHSHHHHHHHPHAASCL